MIMFIDREEELDNLLEIAKSKKAELVLIYGRRRVGKSRLLVEFAKKTDALYLLADISENILDILAKQISKEFVKFNNGMIFLNLSTKVNIKLL
jgi:AAA+ ATPase superfamily predicted ATPase